MTNVVMDFSQGRGARAATHWKIHRLGALPAPPPGWRVDDAKVFDDGIGFAFGADPYSRLFMTSSQGSGLLGDLTGETLTATFTITGTAKTFDYDPGPPDRPDTKKNETCVTLPSVRLYFEDSTHGPYTNDTPGWSRQWWSTPQAYDLASVAVSDDPFTLTVPLDKAMWTNKGFESAQDIPTYFAAAVAKVGAVGLSFGGGCFLPTGAYPTDGTASFVLKSYSVHS